MQHLIQKWQDKYTVERIEYKEIQKIVFCDTLVDFFIIQIFSFILDLLSLNLVSMSSLTELGLKDEHVILKSKVG